VKLVPAHWDDPDVQQLPAAQQRELRSRYDGVCATVFTGFEDAARERGWTTLRLETGPRQPEAFERVLDAS